MSESRQRYWAVPLTIVAVALLAANVALMVTLYTGAAPVTYQQGDYARILASIGQTNGQQINIISLSGTGTVSVVPDQVKVQLGVETRTTTAVEAQRMNGEKMNEVITALRDSGIADEKIKTSGFGLTPVTEKPEEPWRSEYEVVGYICSNNVVFTVDDISTAGDIIDLAVTAGANTVQGVYFTISDEKSAELRNQATEMAVKDAEAKANLIADAAGVELIGPTSISIGSFYIPEYRTSYDEVAGAPAPTPILPGQMDITVTVNINYAFE